MYANMKRRPLHSCTVSDFSSPSHSQFNVCSYPSVKRLYPKWRGDRPIISFVCTRDSSSQMIRIRRKKTTIGYTNGESSIRFG